MQTDTLATSGRPPNEAGRLAAVRRYDILDTPPDGVFDRVTELAARLFDVPIAIVSIVDEDRIWFKSHHGLDVGEIDREPGLCASAILHHEPWVVSDASIDPRTMANPLVAGGMGLRFYAGAPLTTADGYNLGTLCVIDKAPRTVTESEISTLTDLAALVVDELELRLAARRAVDLEQQLRRQAEELAGALQTSLLPPTLPDIPGAELAALYRPADLAQVGGDFYDLFPIDPHTWGIVIGDVCGKGPVAASRGALARYSLRGAAVRDASPRAVLGTVNRAMLAGADVDDPFCTLVFALVARVPGGLEVRVAVGGHPLPTLLRSDGRLAQVGRPGSIVGALDNTEFHDDTVLVEPGDTLVLVTDGLLEIHTDDGVIGQAEFEQRLSGCRGKNPADLVTCLVDGINIYDDVAILALKAV